MAEQRWLDEGEQQTWRAFRETIIRLDQALDRQLLADSGIPHAYYMILSVLSEAPERTLRMGDLAALSSSSQSRLSHAVNRLEESGWVRRERSPGNKREVLATLTDAGMELVRSAAPGHVDAVRNHLFDRLTPAQVRQLERICRAALDSLPRGDCPTRPGDGPT